MVAFVSLNVLVHPKAFCSTMLGCINAFFIPLSQLNCVFYCHFCALDLKDSFASNRFNPLCAVRRIRARKSSNAVLQYTSGLLASMDANSLQVVRSA